MASVFVYCALEVDLAQVDRHFAVVVSDVVQLAGVEPVAKDLQAGAILEIQVGLRSWSACDRGRRGLIG